MKLESESGVGCGATFEGRVTGKKGETIVIEAEICNGCNICQKKCPENAIIGSIKLPHFIIESKCTGCGICFDSCKFNAIYYK